MRALSRPRAIIAGAAVFALAAAGFAIADPTPASISSVTATFYANTLVKSHSATCTGANNDAFQVTDAWFTGTSTSTDTHLAGPITIHVKSVYDSTKNLGSLSADVRVGPTPPGPDQFHGRLNAVNMNGTVQGYLMGNEPGDGHLQGSVTATFSPTTGFSSSGSPATLGAGTGTNTAIVSTGHCENPKPNPPNPPKPHHDDHPGHGPKH